MTLVGDWYKVIHAKMRVVQSVQRGVPYIIRSTVKVIPSGGGLKKREERR